ncbi:LysR family transcriptional regulator [Endozoicomonadaceae bacterium StTr2]
MQQSHDLNEALIFVSIVEAGSMTAAAERLGMQKSTVSRRLSAMEQRIGVRLLQRSTRKNVLTEIGEGHYQRCRQIVQAFKEAENILQTHKEEPSGKLNVVVPIEVGQLFFARFLGAFVQRWPKVSLNVELSNRRIDFREEDIDLALGLQPPNDQNLVCRQIKASPSRLVASPRYAQARQIRHPSDITAMNCIAMNSAHMEHQFDWTFTRKQESVSVDINSNLSFNNITAVREATIAGAGIALLPELIVEKSLQQKELLLLLPEWSLPDRYIYAIYPPRHFMPLALRTLLDEISADIQNSEHGYPNSIGSESNS